MKVYTQATVNQTLPTGALWWPCVITESVPHSAAQQQPLLPHHEYPQVVAKWGQ